MKNKPKTILIELQTLDDTEYYEVIEQPGGRPGDLVFHTARKRFHPVFRLGNTHFCFTPEVQGKIHKVVRSSRVKDRVKLIV